MKKKSTRKKPSRQGKVYTAWHVYLVALLRYFLEDSRYGIHAFYKVGMLPLEIDIIIVKEEHEKGLTKRELAELLTLFEHLNKFTMIEYKSPKDTLSYTDFDILRAHALLYKSQEGIALATEITIMTMSSRLTKSYKDNFRKNGHPLVESTLGVYEIEGGVEVPFKYVGIELDQISQEARNSLLSLLSSRADVSTETLLEQNPDDARILEYLMQNVFEKEMRKMKMPVTGMKELRKNVERIRKMSRVEYFKQMKFQEIMEIWEELSPEDRDAFFKKIPFKEKAKTLMRVVRKDRGAFLKAVPSRERTALLKEMPAKQKTEFLKDMSSKERIALLKEMSSKQKTEFLKEMPSKEKAEFLKEMPAKEKAEFLKEMPAKEKAEFLKEMPAKEKAEFLKEMPAKEKAEFLKEMLPKERVAILKWIPSKEKIAVLKDLEPEEIIKGMGKAQRQHLKELLEKEA